MLDNRAHQGDHLVAGNRRLLERVHFGDRIIALVVQRGEMRTGIAFDKHTHGAVGHLEHLKHLRRHADIVEVRPFRVLARRVQLSEEEHVLVAFHRRFKRGDGSLAADEYRHNHAGEDNDVAEGKQRKTLGHKYLLARGLVARPSL